MIRLRTIVMVIAALACGLLATAQASFAFASMPHMDAECFSHCLDQALQDFASPSSAILAAAFAVVAAVWSFAVPTFAPRFKAAVVLSRDLRRRGPLQQRRE